MFQEMDKLRNDFFSQADKFIEKKESELTYVGKNEEGQDEFIGTRTQWEQTTDRWGSNGAEWDEEDQE